MLGITDLYIILSNLDYSFDMTKVVDDNGFVLVEVKGLFNNWRRLTPMQLERIQCILSPNYKVRLVRKFYKWTIWEQEIIGGKFPC